MANKLFNLDRVRQMLLRAIFIGGGIIRIYSKIFVGGGIIRIILELPADYLRRLWWFS